MQIDVSSHLADPWDEWDRFQREKTTLGSVFLWRHRENECNKMIQWKRLKPCFDEFLNVCISYFHRTIKSMVNLKLRSSTKKRERKLVTNKGHQQRCTELKLSCKALMVIYYGKLRQTVWYKKYFIHTMLLYTYSIVHTMPAVFCGSIK